MDDKTQRDRPTAAPLLSKWDYWRVSWLTLACTIIKLMTFARWLPQWDTWWKMAVLEKRTNDREALVRQLGPPRDRPKPRPRPTGPTSEDAATQAIAEFSEKEV